MSLEAMKHCNDPDILINPAILFRIQNVFRKYLLMLSIIYIVSDVIV